MTATTRVSEPLCKPGTLQGQVIVFVQQGSILYFIYLFIFYSWNWHEALGWFFLLFGPPVPLLKMQEDHWAVWSASVFPGLQRSDPFSSTRPGGGKAELQAGYLEKPCHASGARRKVRKSPACRAHLTSPGSHFILGHPPEEWFMLLPDPSHPPGTVFILASLKIKTSLPGPTVMGLTLNFGCICI